MRLDYALYYPICKAYAYEDSFAKAKLLEGMVNWMQEKRIERLRKVMQQQNLPAILITNAYNRTYVSGFTGSAGYVLITLDRAFLLTDFRYMTQAPQQAKLFEVVEHKSRAIDTVLDSCRHRE